MPLNMLVLAATLGLGASGGIPDFVAASERVRPAVVKVESSLAADARIDGVDDPRRFFAIPEHHGMASAGSGFIVASDGYVLTNHHVIEHAAEIRVRLADQRSFEARLVGSDRQSDIAVLKIEAGDLPVIEYGDSDALKPGEWVVAIGSPFNMDFSVTAGIVSGKGRSLGLEQRFVPFIQTDVPINRGNSGGPLIGLDGRVVGMNSAIFSQSGGYIGLSFAIPARTVQDVAGQIRASGQVERGFLGVGYQDVGPELARALGLQAIGGALVNQVQPGSAAARAGMRLGDVVLAVNGTPLRQAADLPPLVAALRPEQAARLALQRDGKPLALSVPLGRLPQRPPAPTRPPGQAATEGLELRDAEAAELELLQAPSAAIVVRAGPAAHAAGLRRGDAIVAVASQAPERAAALHQRLQAARRDDVALALLVRRGAQTLFIGWGAGLGAVTLH